MSTEITAPITINQTNITAPVSVGTVPAVVTSHVVGDGTDHSAVGTMQGQAHDAATAGDGILITGQQIANTDKGTTARTAHESAYAHADIAGTATRATNLESKVGPGTGTGAALKDYTEAAQSISSSSGVVTIDLSQPVSHYYLTLTENVTSVVLTNIPASPAVVARTIEVTQHASSPMTWAWGAGWLYNNSAAPAVTATAGKKDFFQIFTRDGGTTKIAGRGWYNVG